MVLGVLGVDGMDVRYCIETRCKRRDTKYTANSSGSNRNQLLPKYLFQWHRITTDDQEPNHYSCLGSPNVSREQVTGHKLQAES